MVRIRVSIEDDYNPPRRLPVCIAHRANRPVRPPYGFQDMPTRIEGEYRQTADGTYREWHARASRYDLAMMWNWSSYKAILCMKTEGDVVEGLGLREALSLALENPDYWPIEPQVRYTDIPS